MYIHPENKPMIHICHLGGQKASSNGKEANKNCYTLNINFEKFTRHAGTAFSSRGLSSETN